MHHINEHVENLRRRMEVRIIDGRDNLYAASAICGIVALCAVILRIWARRRGAVRFQWDDWLSIVALLPILGMAICLVMAIYYGLGLHMPQVLNKELYFKSIVAAGAFYSVALMPTKLSMLFLYYRYFPTRKLYITNFCLAVFMAGSSTVHCAVVLLQCLPLSSLWTGRPGNCLDLSTMLIVFSLMNIITEAAIFGITMPCTWKLNLKPARRIQLISVFVLGLGVMALSLLRTMVLTQRWSITADAEKSSRLNLSIFMISIVEISLALLTACLPTFSTLLGSTTAARNGHNGVGPHLDYNRDKFNRLESISSIEKPHITHRPVSGSYTGEFRRSLQPVAPPPVATYHHQGDVNNSRGQNLLSPNMFATPSARGQQTMARPSPSRAHSYHTSSWGDDVIDAYDDVDVNDKHGNASSSRGYYGGGPATAGRAGDREYDGGQRRVRRRSSSESSSAGSGSGSGNGSGNLTSSGSGDSRGGGLSRVPTTRTTHSQRSLLSVRPVSAV